MFPDDKPAYRSAFDTIPLLIGVVLMARGSLVRRVRGGWMVSLLGEGEGSIAKETTSPVTGLLMQLRCAADIVYNYRTCTASLNK